MVNKPDLTRKFINGFFDEEIMNFIWLAYLYVPPIDFEAARTTEQIIALRDLQTRLLAYVDSYTSVLSDDKLEMPKSDLIQLLIEEISIRVKEYDG